MKFFTVIKMQEFYTKIFSENHLKNLAFALLTESEDSLSLANSNFENAMTIPKSIRPITAWMVAIHDETCKEWDLMSLHQARPNRSMYPW